MPPKKNPKTTKPPKEDKPPSPPTDNVKDVYFGKIEIHIRYLESKVDVGVFTLVVAYARNYVGRVGRIHIPQGGGKVKINRTFYLYIKAMDNYVMDALLGTPFFFSMIEGENKADPTLFATQGTAAGIQTKVVGQGNLGIMPLLTGQFEMESVIILEPPGMQETVFFKKKFSQHPRLYVKLIDARKNLSAIELNNIMWLSVESVYNFDPCDFLEDAGHTLVFPLPATSLDEEQAVLEGLFGVRADLYEEVRPEPKKTPKKGKHKASPRNKPQKKESQTSIEVIPPDEITEHPDFDLIQFDRGIYKSEQTCDNRKKWSSLASINGAPAMTDQRENAASLVQHSNQISYPDLRVCQTNSFLFSDPIRYARVTMVMRSMPGGITTDSNDLFSTFPIDLVKKYRSDYEPRIEWNMVRPIWLHDGLEHHIKERILQYGVWPVEVLMLAKTFMSKEDIKREKIKEYKDIMINLKSGIDDIITELSEILEEDDSENEEFSERMLEIPARIDELLKKFCEKKIGNEVSPEKKDEGTNADLSEEEFISAEDSGSEASIKDPKKILNQDDIVVLERKSFIAWLDLSPLLVPGCTHIRTAGVLQYFNSEEAIAKWGLTTTFTGISCEMKPWDKELSSMTCFDLDQLYSYMEEKYLSNNTSYIQAMMDCLLEISNDINNLVTESRESSDSECETSTDSSPAKEAKEKKRTKGPKSQDKKKVKPGQHSKIKPDGLIKEKTNLTPKAGQLKKDSTSIYGRPHVFKDMQDKNLLTMKAFDFNEIEPSEELFEKNLKKPSPTNVSSVNGEEQSIDEEEDMLKIKTMQHYLNRSPSHSQHFFALNKTYEKQEEEIKSPEEDPSPEEEISNILSMESFPSELSAVTDSSSEDLELYPPLQPDSKLVKKYKPKLKTTPKLKNEQGESRMPQPSVQPSQQITSTGIPQLTEEEPFLDLIKTLLLTVIDKYGKLKNRYRALKKMKVKTVTDENEYIADEDEDTTDEDEEITDENEDITDENEDIIDECLSLNDETGIIKVDPRHKMWQIDVHLNDELMENQIQYTNDFRKMAVLEREFLSLKRLRLAQMKHTWEEKLKKLNPEYLENAQGEKVIVIIEIKLLKPLVPKPTLTEIDLDIHDFVKAGETKAKPVHYANDTVVEFHNCITNLSNLIKSEYQDFKKLCSSVINPLSGETGNDFYEYIEKSRAHQIITESLSEAMKGYLATALRDPIPTEDKNDQKKLRYYVGWLYTRVVDEMQSVVNKAIIEGDPSLPDSSFGDLPNISSYDRYLFAVEAIEEMDYDRAKYYLAKRLEGYNMKEPMQWIEYAVIALRIGDYQQAMECIKEALVLDSRCKEALIMYAVMLMTEGRFEDSLIFFNALINFYPMFVEGWMAFHMFYLITENKSGADITLVAGTKISYDFKLPTPMKPPQLSWDNKTWIGDEPGNYISTAIYFLSFNMYEIAEVCLARELERVGTKTLVWVYYLSVCHYIQGRYEDSAKHLSKAISELHEYNMDPRIWMLLGHNCWMMGLKKAAVHMYLQAFTKKKDSLFDHMMYIRCGFFFLEKENGKFAKQMFLRAVRQQGTPMGWLGLGIALFMEGQLEDAELALKEANMLDTTLATAWGYLALISLFKLREDQFIHCFREAKRYGLDDKKLLFEIEMICQHIVTYSKPNLSQESQSSL